MKTRAIALLVFCALGSASLACGERWGDLEPSDDYFSWVGPPDPYHAAVREALVGEHSYRKCQMVVLPSFRREWAVYIVREEGSPAQVLFKRFRKPLWGEMMSVLSDSGRKTSFSIESEAQQAALAHLEMDLDRWATTVDERTADLLEDVWWRMLGRTRYTDNAEIGHDGTSYHVAHWRKGGGFRSGQTWSPNEGSRAGRLVSLAENMAEYARAPSAQLEEALIAEARAMLTLLDQQQ